MRKLVFSLLLVLSVAGVEFFTPPFLPDAFISAGLPDQKDAAVCIDKELAQCQANFNWFLNITDSADWSNPELLIHAIRSYFQKGVPGLLQVCKARTFFYQCLQPNYAACMTETKFLKNGLSLQNASRYIGIMREMEFMCNGGMLQSISHWDCIGSIEIAGKDDFQKCKEKFNNVTHNNPSVVCGAAVDMTNCVRAPFQLCGDEVSWWGCERARISLNTDRQCPVNTCSFNGQGDQVPKRFFPKSMKHSEQLASIQHMPADKLQFLATHAARMEEKLKNY